MSTASSAHFDRQYRTHLKHLKLKGLQPKTIEAYARAIRRLGGYFSHRIDELSEAQLSDYFSDLIGTHSWSAVKLDLYGLKFYTTHVLRKPWVMPHLIKLPKTQRLSAASRATRWNTCSSSSCRRTSAWANSIVTGPTPKTPSTN